MNCQETGSEAACGSKYYKINQNEDVCFEEIYLIDITNMKFP
jgi:hypothetical protein